MSGQNNIELLPAEHIEQLSSRFGMIISARFSIGGFARAWRHCHRMANYLARYASANEGDPERHATMLSTFFNEVLEVIFRHHARSGQIAMSFHKRNGRVYLRAIIPLDDEAARFYQSASDLVGQPDPMSWYRDRLEHAGDVDDDQALGLLELAAIYGSVFSISKLKEGKEILLSIDFPLESEEET